MQHVTGAATAVAWDSGLHRKVGKARLQSLNMGRERRTPPNTQDHITFSPSSMRIHAYSVVHYLAPDVQPLPHNAFAQTESSFTDIADTPANVEQRHGQEQEMETITRHIITRYE